jgi:hypothetical protein
LELAWEGRPVQLTSLDVGEVTTTAWIDARRAVLLRSLTQPRGRAFDPSLASLDNLLSSLVRADTRTAEEYEEQVEQYLTACQEKLADAAIAAMIDRELNMVALVATNPNKINLPQVELTMHVPGRVLAMEEAPADGQPTPPRPFGTPEPHPVFGQIAAAGLAPSLMPQFLARGGFPPRLHIENGGSATLTFQVGDLRPHGRAVLDEFYLLVAEGAGTTISATWTATSTGLDDLLEGAFEFVVGDRVMTPLDLLPVDDPSGAAAT